MMTREEKYDAVNKTETLKELADVILTLADEDGMIQGKSRKFHADRMAFICKHFDINLYRILTRNYGIRQQALMLKFHDDLDEAAKELIKRAFDDKKG